MEFNKIFASILAAGIIAMLAGFVASETVKPVQLKQDAYKIEVANAAPASGAPAAPEKAEPIDKLMAKADPAHGEQLSHICSACHSFDKGGPNKVGPNLFGIVGDHHAHKKDYSYSDAMEAKKSEIWTVDALNAWIWSPQKTVPGTKMSFAGLKKPQDRADLIKWLEAQK